MIAESVRSGLVETRHPGAVVAMDADGRELGQWGDPDVPIFYRSAVKPFQATVAQELGAELAPEQMAVACASHGGYPVHISLVRSMLAQSGLDASALGTPPDRPLSPEASLAAAARGEHELRAIFHNCSGKHAAWLRACVASGFPIATYLDPDHPLQRAVAEIIVTATGADGTPVGVDGCGAPVFRGTVRRLAVGFARLTVDPRFGDAARAMQRFPALTADHRRLDGRLAAWFGGPVKVGAAGLIAAGRHGVGIAARAYDGSATAAVVGIVEAMRRLSLLSRAALDALSDVARPPVHGGRRIVGEHRPALSAASRDQGTG